LAAARAEIAKLQRVLGTKTLENEILKEAVEYAAGKKVDCALALVAQGRRPMKTVCQALGLARSHVHAVAKRSVSWQDRRSARTCAGDLELLNDIRSQIAHLTSYGYRRACACTRWPPDAGLGLGLGLGGGGGGSLHHVPERLGERFKLQLLSRDVRARLLRIRCRLPLKQ